MFKKSYIYYIFTYMCTLYMHTYIFLKGGSKFWLPPLEAGKSEKVKKLGGNMVQEQVFLKGAGGGGGGGAGMFPNFLKVYNFYI